MTPHEFLTKWRNAELKERSASQSHFNDLCALLGVPDPVTADRTGEWFTFEKGASKTSGGEGWADVWRKGCFAWEYKGRRKDLKAAFNQLLQYSVALENPPLLIVSDMDRILVHTNWTNTVQEVHQFELDDLLDGAKRERLKQAFSDPEAFRPTTTRQALTEETAREFAGLAQRLRDRGHEAHEVAHFVNQLVFCMFAEDVGLLPDNLFTKMLEVSRRDPAGFSDNAATLFGAMAVRNGKVGFTAIDWFNGGLFKDDQVLPVSTDDIDDLLKAARRDWSQIDPSILGTLFERGLDPAKRSQLGAHYTDREKIMLIVTPVIIEPLEAEWAAAKAVIEAAMIRVSAAKARVPEKQSEARKVYAAARRAEEAAYREAVAAHRGFIERLRDFRVLDPACGSGNFLYVALKALKDIEHRANLDAEKLGLQRHSPEVGPECVLGIELNQYAAELARVSVWIGEIQWMRRHGFEATKNPILRPLETIECRDAVLNDDGTRAEWPEADVIIGNPPFLGSRYLRNGRPATRSAPALAGLGDEYVDRLFAAYARLVPQGANFVAYWFSKAGAALQTGAERVGLVATQAIRRGASRNVVQSALNSGAEIFDAWSNESWSQDGAQVRVSIICFRRAATGADGRLDGLSVSKISADLRADVAQAMPYVLGTNRNMAAQGTISGGPFEVPPDLAREFLRAPVNPNQEFNAAVIRPWRNGDDVTDRHADWWIIDFGDDRSAEEAALFEAPFRHLSAVWDEAQEQRRAAGDKLLREGEPRTAARWWILQRRRSRLLRDLENQDRYLATPRVSKHRFFVWLDPSIVPDTRLVVFRRQDDIFAGILQSKLHEVWSLRFGGNHGVGNDPEYVHTTIFETFPFPEGLTPDIPTADYADDPRAQKIASAAMRLNELRENWLNPADLVVREPEVVPGYPDRILPKDDEAAKELKKRTLTNLYNARPQWLANAHAALDEAVAEAYGWGDDWRASALTDDEILARLFRLNQERSSQITTGSAPPSAAKGKGRQGPPPPPNRP